MPKTVCVWGGGIVFLYELMTIDLGTLLRILLELRHLTFVYSCSLGTAELYACRCYVVFVPLLRFFVRLAWKVLTLIRSAQLLLLILSELGAANRAIGFSFAPE